MASTAAAAASGAAVKAAYMPSPVVFTTAPEFDSMPFRKIASWDANASRIASGCSSHSRVDSSRSVNRKVTVPEGNFVMCSPDTVTRDQALRPPYATTSASVEERFPTTPAAPAPGARFGLMSRCLRSQSCARLTLRLPPQRVSCWMGSRNDR